MKYLVNVDIGIDTPDGKHEPLGSVVDLDEKAAAADVKRGWLAPASESKNDDRPTVAVEKE